MKHRKRVLTMNLTIRRILTLTLALALMLTVCACGGETAVIEGSDAQQAQTQTAYTGEAALHSNAYGYDSWSIHFESDDSGQVAFSYMDKDAQLQTMSQEAVNALLDLTVASCGELALNNRELNLYYQQTLYDFYQQYGSYLMYMMDTSIGMDEQLGMSGETTWQADLLTAALANFNQVASLYQDALANGFEMTEDSRTFLDELREGLDEAAVSNGYADADEYLADTFGPGITYDDYYHFSEINSLAMDYYNVLAEQITVDDAALEAYYAENEDMFTSQGVLMDDRNVVNVRHILISVDDSTDDAAWTAAEQEAQALLQQWKDGDATEDSFAELATEKTEDPGSQSTGGLYEDVYPGQMVEPFETWCFDETRQAGDTGIVKTDYGYHVMYFVGQGDYVYWRSLAEAYYRSEAATDLRAEVTAKYETTSDVANVILLEYAAPTAPAAEETTEDQSTTELDPVEE